MNSGPSSAAVYTDLNGLASLRMEAKTHSQAALRQVAQQFESLFMQMMMKSMREAKLADGVFDNDQSAMYQDLMDKQLSVDLSQNHDALGIANLLIRQFQGAMPDQGAAGSSPATGRQEFAVPPRNPALNVAGAATAPQQTAAATSSASETGAKDPVAFSSPEQFVRYLWPQAQKVGKQLGVDPQALIAQAALETGWGRSVIRHNDGRSSYNLFNIKADGRWSGDRVAKQTLEYSDGVARREVASFRSYGSYAESFADYARFLRSNPRYHDALAHAHDAEGFIQGLHDAGYATDPTYADKIKGIMHSDTVQQSLALLKVSGGRTLS